MLAPPNVSAKQPLGQSEKNLFSKADSKRTSLFGAFEGLFKQLQTARGKEKQSLSKETLSAAHQTSAQIYDVKKVGNHKQADKVQNARHIKPAGNILTEAAVLREGTSKKSENLSSTLGKDVVPLSQKQQRSTHEQVASLNDQDTQTAKKQRESFKNNRNQGIVKDVGAEQNGQVLAVYTTLGLQAQQNRIKAEPSEGPQESKIRKYDQTRDKRKERIDVEVYDLRTQTIEAKAKLTESNSSQESTTKTVELTLHLKEESGKNIENPRLSSTQSPSRSFQDMLAQELRTSMNGDIVRHASMVLKDGGEGLIRLNLKPETLGNVRIKLEMADNKVTGHILVETEEALRAFEKEIHSLEQAFKDGGFQGASLEVSVSADGRGSGGFQQGQMPQPFYSDRLVASSYDNTTPGLMSPIQNSSLSSGTNLSINMLA
ncbi:flagellar hook-length control protein FliK [Gracilinema caldarium]|uniref:Flagellar hook-length control protein n=1 Tax=Gracilinema caldarium (strain ATCC 51460 / DSM 7334 / H1) TaxID=744872 RepID=F8EZ91_GRAC1|nr:flagellar hook-length control protein FliK [Gracilinema caldarium]AEJ19683.1 Flagellar hook-length control protein [Gracilinema caldarium DSM 7334]